MLSSTLLRRNPHHVLAGLRRRGAGLVAEAALAEWIALDQERVALVRTSSPSRSALRALEERMLQAALRLPNMPDDAVPDGVRPDDNVEVARWGEPAEYHVELRTHEVILARLGGLDLARATRTAGTRFPLLLGPTARLARALTAFLLDMHTRQGYIEVAPPHLLLADTLERSAHLPAHRDEMYALPDERLYLSPTAEAQLVGMVEGQLLVERDLPLAFTAATPCYRREAGSAGAATRGLLRQHQFDKVELVRIGRPEDAEAELERILADVERPLRALGLPYRVMALCAGELPFAAERAYDVEAWFAGEDRYIEISSVSLCGAFQARRLNARYKPAGDKRARHVITLNASALPIGRTLAALVEAGQRPDGTVTLPEALAPWFGGTSLSRE